LSGGVEESAALRSCGFWWKVPCAPPTGVMGGAAARGGAAAAGGGAGAINFGGTVSYGFAGSWATGKE
jgi:hypothetical protein